MMIFATLIDGWGDLAEWFLVVATILFIAAGCLAVTNRPDPSHGSLLPWGLALVAVALLIL